MNKGHPITSELGGGVNRIGSRILASLNQKPKPNRQGGSKMEGKRCKSNLLAHFLLTLMLPNLIHSLGYPIFTSKRFGKALPPHLQALFPVARIPADFEVPDYDDNYSPYAMVEEQEKYPLAPIYGYVKDQPNGGSFIDYEDVNEQRNYPYGREAWADDGDRDDKSAFLQSLMLGEIDPQPNEADSGIVYGTPVEYSPDYEDEERDEPWYYGVPVYEPREDARSRKDDSVRQLESLAKKMKAEEAAFNMQNEELVPFFENDVFLNQWQKRMSRSGRKNNVFFRKGFKTNDKRMYSPQKSTAATDARQNLFGKSTDSDGKNKTELTTSIPQPKASPTGQKEYVLPRPANPVRKPLQRGIFTRSPQKPNVYEAIKKLLAKEGLKKESRPRIQKRFVLSDDQLTTQLSGLKRIAV